MLIHSIDEEDLVDDVVMIDDMIMLVSLMSAWESEVLILSSTATEGVKTRIPGFLILIPQPAKQKQAETHRRNPI